MNTNALGTWAEYYFATESIKRGFKISFPLMDSSPYDCVLDDNGNLYKIQVKSSNKVPVDSINNVLVTLNNQQNIYTKKNVDYFAIYSSYFGGFFVFPNKGNMQSIRLTLVGRNRIFFNNFVFNCET